MIKIEVLEKDIPYEELLPVVHDAFKERLEQGLNFVCATFTLDEFIENMKGMSAIVARQVEENVNRIVGFQKFIILNQCFDTGIIAVLSEFKRQGIGSMIYEKSQELGLARGCKYMVADTAAGAESSVKWHLKNGYKIVGLDSYPSTNYYSYLFRKQLVYHPLWSNSLYCKIHYLLSALRCRLRFHADGTNTKLLNCYLKIRQK